MTTPLMKKSVLVAAMPDADARLSVILAGHELHFVRTLQAATAALAGGKFQLVVIDLHFDDSRMFDLLRHIRTRGEFDAVAVMCVRTQRAQWASVTTRGLEIAVKALGGHGFVDLSVFADDDAGNRSVRALIEGLLQP